MDNKIIEVIENVKKEIPSYLKDIRLNLESVTKTSLSEEELLVVLVSASFSLKNKKLLSSFNSKMEPALLEGVITSASLMGMTNVWYSFTGNISNVELKNNMKSAGLRMNSYLNFGGIGQKNFEIAALASSILAKCVYCVNSHIEGLMKLGVTENQIKDIGRIVSILNSVDKFV